MKIASGRGPRTSIPSSYTLALFLLPALLSFTPACSQSKSDSTIKGQKAPAICSGETINICSLPGEYELDLAISEILADVKEKSEKNPSSNSSLESAHVTCAEIAYPGNEAAIKAEKDKRGTFICLFNNTYSMNMALNRLSTFIEDFETVDENSDYSNAKWVEDQKTNGSLGHNLESQDLRRYLQETSSHISSRANSDVPGIRLETEFLEQYIKPKIDQLKGKPTSIVLGVPLPETASLEEAEAQLKAVLGHEIFHSLYFHSKNLQGLVSGYIDALSAEEVALMQKRLAQKGYEVTNEDGSPASEKQKYMFYNEAQAYLLESGACTDGAFMSYKDETAEDLEAIKDTAPLVVKHAANLRNLLLHYKIISPAWASKWSPDLLASGCKE